MKYFTDEEINSAVEVAPKVVQEEIATGYETAGIIRSMGRTFELHIDQMAKIAELNRNMLLGLIGPDEFFSELLAVGIPDASARQIMAEINEKIFEPLHERIRKGEGANSKVVPPTSSAMNVQRVAPQAKPPQVPAVPLTQTPSVSVADLPPKAALPRQTSTPATVPAAMPPRLPVSIPSTVPPVQQALPVTGPSINKLSGWRSDTPGAPQASLPSAPVATTVPSVAPEQTAPAPQAPRTAPPPPNLPGAPVQAPQVSPPPAPPIVKEYSADPYREPIDDRA